MTHISRVDAGKVKVHRDRGLSFDEIAALFGVSRSTISGIVYRRGWAQTKKPRWTPERDKQLRDLVAAGLSNQAIGETLGLTRVAIQRRLARLRLQQHVILRPKPVKRPRLRLPTPKPTPIVRAQTTLPEPDPLKLTILTLEPSSCRWPVGTLDDKPEFFCGHPAFRDGPYCEHHHARAYVPAQPKQSRAA